MALRVHPGPEDRDRGAEAAAPPGDVLALAAAPVAEVGHPEGEIAVAGFVAEDAAADDVAGLVVGGLDERPVGGERGQPARSAGLVDETEHRPLLRVEGGSALVLTVAGLGSAWQGEESRQQEEGREGVSSRHRLVIPEGDSLTKRKERDDDESPEKRAGVARAAHA